MEKSDSWNQAQLAHYEFALDIQASSQRVWRALTDQIGHVAASFPYARESSLIEFDRMPEVG